MTILAIASGLGLSWSSFQGGRGNSIEIASHREIDPSALRRALPDHGRDKSPHHKKNPEANVCRRRESSHAEKHTVLDDEGNKSPRARPPLTLTQGFRRRERVQGSSIIGMGNTDVSGQENSCVIILNVVQEGSGIFLDEENDDGEEMISGCRKTDKSLALQGLWDIHVKS
ncbi:hypothetical protein C8J56DRAFT_890252 [Mycena floridula]|nr:hypothetical protein C8J56DRAFT_890252 [Mycena floridula]